MPDTVITIMVVMCTLIEGYSLMKMNRSYINGDIHSVIYYGMYAAIMAMTLILGSMR